MKRILTATAIVLGTAGLAAAQMSAPIMSAAPSGKTVTKYYKQSVYDPAKDKIGSIDDVIVSDSGQVTGFMVGVGGFLGAGEKDVAVPFQDVNATTKNNKVHLVMNATKDGLKNAPGFKYDSSTTTWVRDKNSDTGK